MFYYRIQSSTDVTMSWNAKISIIIAVLSCNFPPSNVRTLQIFPDLTVHSCICNENSLRLSNWSFAITRSVHITPSSDGSLPF